MTSLAVLRDVPDVTTTARLVLRSPMPGDGAAVNEAVLESWEALHRWMPWAREPPTVEQSEANARQARSSFIARSDLQMLICSKNGSVIGATGLHRMDWSVPSFEIGYWVRRSCERQGYVTEAVKALTRLALETLGAERVAIHCSERNERSQRVAERCGYVLEGRLRCHRRETTGELRDTMIFALIRSDPAAQALLL